MNIEEQKEKLVKAVLEYDKLLNRKFVTDTHIRYLKRMSIAGLKIHLACLKDQFNNRVGDCFGIDS